MNSYLDLLDTDIQIPIHLIVNPIVENGIPRCCIKINNRDVFYGQLTHAKSLEHSIELLDPVCISIHMDNKIYSSEKETAVVVQSLKIDNIELTHFTTDPISYSKDQTNDYIGFYLGFNGLWQYTINKPFYQWYHTATGQGWLFEPR